MQANERTSLLSSHHGEKIGANTKENEKNKTRNDSDVEINMESKDEGYIPINDNGQSKSSKTYRQKKIESIHVTKKWTKKR